MTSSPSSPDRELTLADYGRAIWRGRRILLTAIVVAALAGLALSFIRPTTYTGTAQVFLGQAITDSGGLVTVPATNPTIAPTVLEGDELVDPIAEESGLTPAEIRSGLSITVPRAPGSAGNLPTLAAISFTHSDAETTRLVTNAFADQVVTYNRRIFANSEEVLNRQLAREEQNITRLEAVVARLRSTNASDAIVLAAQDELGAAQTRRSDAELGIAQSADLREPGIITRAATATSSSSAVRRVRTVVLSALIGAILGIILALAWSGREQRVEAA